MVQESSRSMDQPRHRAAHRARVGDILILAAFGQFTEIEAKTHSPQVIFVNQHNQIITKAEATALGVMTDPVPNP